MTRWIIEKSDGFTDVGLYRISESVRAYAYLILSSQASARSSIVGNTVSALTAQSAFLNPLHEPLSRASPAGPFWGLTTRKNCFGTGFGKWFCNMEYVSMISNYSSNQNMALTSRINK